MPRNFVPSNVLHSPGVPFYEDHEMGAAYPALYQLLCASVVDGKPRLGASLTFFAEQGRLKASIFDRSTSMVWFATLEGSSGLLEQVESLLQAGKGDWRQKRAR